MRTLQNYIPVRVLQGFANKPEFCQWSEDIRKWVDTVSKDGHIVAVVVASNGQVSDFSLYDIKVENEKE